MDILIDLVLICIFSYIIIKFIIDFITKIIYVNSTIDDSIKKEGEIYINLYDYRKEKILTRAILKEKSYEELKINRNLIISIEDKKRIIYKYFRW